MYYLRYIWVKRKTCFDSDVDFTIVFCFPILLLHSKPVDNLIDHRSIRAKINFLACWNHKKRHCS